MTAASSSLGTRIGALWLDHPSDHLSHAWRYVVDGGNWRAVCGLVSDPKTLTEPEDEFGRHNDCVLKLGDEEADRQDQVRQRMRDDMRDPGHWSSVSL